MLQTDVLVHSEKSTTSRSSTTSKSSIFGFPDPVNEVAARLVAAVVAVTAIAIVATGWLWLFVPLAYGFWARVLTGPTLSPLGRAAVRLAPVLADPRHVPGPPKRFAQGIGATLSTVGLLAFLSGTTGVGIVVAAMVAFAATLESVFALCLGCHMFRALIRFGILDESACESCNDLPTHLDRSAA